MRTRSPNDPVRDVVSNRRGRVRIAVLAALAFAVAAISIRTYVDYLSLFPFGVDLHIPLEAARRWLAGGSPYLVEGFSLPGGYDLPFLYPPIVLPVFALLTVVPGTVLYPMWLLAALAATVFACRRLAVPWAFIPLLTVWAPFYESLVTGNVQIFLFAAFAALFWISPANAPFAPRRKDLERQDGAGGLLNALLAVAVGAVKVAQVHAWLYVLRVRPVAALLAAALATLALVATLPILGVDLWLAWADQLRRASDPNWVASGAGLATLLGPSAAVAITAITLAAVPFVDRARAGAWVGLLIVVASPNLHTQGLVFLLPAMLLLRREIALVVAALIAAYNPITWWMAIALIAWSLTAAPIWPRLYEPASSASD